MAELPGIASFSGKKGPKTYKAAKGASGRGNFGNTGQKPANKSRNSKVDRKVKRISNKVIGFKSKNSGPAAHDRY